MDYYARIISIEERNQRIKVRIEELEERKQKLRQAQELIMNRTSSDTWQFWAKVHFLADADATPSAT